MLNINRREKRRIAQATGRARRTITEPERWVIGAIDRVTGRVAMQVLPNGRSSRTIAACSTFIAKHTLPFSAIVTDTASCYSSNWIRMHRYHFKCNHSIGQRVVPGMCTVASSAVGTQAIEQMWNQVREFARGWKIEKSKMSAEAASHYMNEFCWRKNNGLMNNPPAAFNALCAILHARA